MKLHRPLVQAVIATLDQIFEQGQFADKAVEQVLKQNQRWGSRDRRFIAETVYEMVRWRRYYSGILAAQTTPTPPDYYKLFVIKQVLDGEELPDWPEFKEVDRTEILKNAAIVEQTRKFKESVPDWLDEMGSQELGEQIWGEELHALNSEAKVVLRVNELKTSRIQLQRLLAEQQIETWVMDDYPQALILQRRQNLQQLAEYKQGLFEIQDASSQLIAPFLEVEEGMQVIDACAGAGGKSLHLAAAMKNKGSILSMDVEERKLIELKKRSERAGISIIKTQTIQADSIKKLAKSADRLLLDVPCSGLGVLRRNPDAKWKLSPDFLNTIRQTQQHILSDYATMLKPEGVMVYATCSILPSENQDQVTAFLKKNEKSFELIEDKKIMPSDGFDGFYMAKLKRIN
ncbi:MAG TPA: RsmB/NOP family class I SAM-dependent RNA methyltransferase [Bacteroidia bacterium]|jgi:16S rRNA (cytosine967-C5)-methyltransferase|nr:RsmB/NOP family class I SAM-dependent RNA methyltransferase [Bacteroidia bacterium]